MPRAGQFFPLALAFVLGALAPGAAAARKPATPWGTSWGRAEDAPGAQGTAPWESTLQRDGLGLEIQRSLPGGLTSRWTRDRTGRPIQHDVWADQRTYRRRQYHWSFDDRLQQVTDAGVGPTKYGHDALGQLAWAQFSDGMVDLRMPDAVGNLFRTQDRSDRKYGPAGQLLEQRTREGVTKYEYDFDGNLVKKETPRGTWTYHWNGAGRLAHVERPDGDEVTFAYDALGRRVSKTFRGKTTYWIWDGNTPLHEWTVEDAAAPVAPPPPVGADGAAISRRAAELAINPPNGPPPEGLITWLFDPESFAPMAKLVGEQRYAIVTDHLGTPVSMVDETGARVWAAEYDTYGNLRAWKGDRGACPFRFPGQYEDAETGLYYNRFRYYDPRSAGYLSRDPLGLRGGLAMMAYVRDPLTWRDPLGLSGSCGDDVTWYHGSLDADDVRANGFSTRNRYGDDRGAPYVCVSTNRSAAENAIDPSARYDAQFADPARTGVVEGRMSREEWDRLHADGHLRTNDYGGFDHSMATTETKAMTPEGVEALNRSMIR